MKKVKTVLTIAGSDPSGGAGIQADLKTISAYELYGMSVITALTAQNTTGVSDVLKVTPEFVGKQLDAVFEDIFPDAVKIGMLSETETVNVVAEKLKFYGAKNVVLDPVMVSTSGKDLLEEQAVTALAEKLMPLAELVTPNIPECEKLCGLSINTPEDMEKAALKLSEKLKTSVLLKGGHLQGDCACDLLVCAGETFRFSAKKLDNPNIHGTGCTLSSAIACELAMGGKLPESVSKAKAYLTGTIAAGLDLGRGNGPLWHFVR